MTLNFVIRRVIKFRTATIRIVDTLMNGHREEITDSSWHFRRYSKCLCYCYQRCCRMQSNVTDRAARSVPVNQ